MFDQPRPSSLPALFSRRVNSRRPVVRRRRGKTERPGLERLDERRMLAFDLVAAYADSVTPFYQKDVSPAVVEINQAPQQITLRFSAGVRLNPATLLDPVTLAANISVVRTGAGGGPVDVGLSVDDLPNENQAVIRFKEALRDGSYQIVVGAGLRSLAAPADSAAATTVNVRVDLGAFVVGVVPQPVTRQISGALDQVRGAIDVYFNTEDPLQKASVESVAFYRLFQVNAETNADIGVPLSPSSVAYDAATGLARLTFGAPLQTAVGLYRLEIGGTPAPTPVVFTSGDDNNSSFTTARDIGALSSNGATIAASIDVRPTVPTPVGQLGYPSQPGTLDTPGQRDVPVDSGAHGVPAFAVVDSATGITTVRYDFRSIIGQDPQGNDLQNVITEAQKQRAREIFELFSLSSGVRFVEVGYDPAVPSLMVATGDLRAFNPNAPAGSIAGLGGPGSGALMNSGLNWGDSEYGGSWFRVAMHEIGHALGLQHSYDLPSIMGADLGGEAVFPGDYDIEHLRQLADPNGSTTQLAPTANDIDVYRFSLSTAGRFSAETVAARPGMPVLSRLDSVLSLYREETTGGRTVRTLVARNDDYYGRDSFVGLDLEAGTYFIAVTSVGNTAFDPAVSDSGANGRTGGDYRLNLGFVPAAAAANTILDLTDRPIDGDRDGVAGGAFKFWFNAAVANNTIYVDKASIQPGAGDGTLANPYKTISMAVSDAQVNSVKTIIRIVGTATAPYQIGTNLVGNPLPDGATFNVPKGVTAMIDGGAVFKLRAANIDVGSSSQLVSRARAAIQVLGIPATGSFAGNQVTFTSWHDDSIGGNSDNDGGPAVQGGQWGGIVLRQDSDAASRRAFVNSISGAVMRYGGGQVVVDSQLEAFAPIQIESTRPTVVFNTITDSAGAAIAATPNSFEDTGDRFGPEFRGNRLAQLRNDGPGGAVVLHQNSVNGLFVKIDTQFGTPLDRLDVPARFKSTDIVYVIQENLVINGGVGGYVDRVSRVGDVTTGSFIVTGLATTADLRVGMQVEIRDPANPDVSALPAGPVTITGILGSSSVQLSAQPLVTRQFATVAFIDPILGFARQSGRLTIDPGVVVKLQNSRIELERGLAQLVAEGVPGKSVIFTSLADNRFGAGGTFDTNGSVPDKYDAVGRPSGTLTSGDWGGIILNAGSKASIDRAYVAFGGGETPIEGGFDNFNVLEVHQGNMRLTNSRVELNSAGSARTGRTGRGGNAAATVFIRGSQPIIVGNDFRSNAGAVISINANSLSDVERGDVGRSTGAIDRFADYDDNFGPLVRGNRLQYASGPATAGMAVRGGEITVESVWDDTDIVHVLQEEIIVQNFHTSTGVRLMSRPDASLVVKLAGANAGFTAAGENLDIDDRIGGTVQVIGQPGYPVVLTSLRDDTVGASLDPLGRFVTDTNVDGAATSPTAGDWRSLRFLPFSNDRNVSILTERERPYTGGIDANGSTANAESLGVLAPNFPTANNTWESAQEKSGDENRRLGFEVHGSVARDSAGDVDVYTFLGYAGSEAWIDIDKTSPALDTMVELLDASGTVKARSVDGIVEGGVVQGEIVTAPLGGTTVTYQFAPPNVAPGGFSLVRGTLSGVIYEGAVAIQTFAEDASGVVTFHDILGKDLLGNPIGGPVTGATASAGTVLLANGQLQLTFATPIGASQVEVRYSYKTSALTSVTGTGDTLGKNAWRGGDYFTQNPRDAGMRVILPGPTQGVLTRYYLRVRSQPRYEPAATPATNGGVAATTAAQYATDVSGTSPAQLAAGATSGRYELRVRLRQRDEKPGSTVRYADIRYPTIGIDVQGLPSNSPLLADTAENPTDTTTDTSANPLASAQYIGNVLESNRGALSVAGNISAEGDIDWYSFALNYEQIQSIGGFSDGPFPWATMFDIDYGDGFRGDLTISVFDQSGRLIYVGRDSNVADDQPGTLQGNDFDDLSKGSLGKLDPFIGTVELVAGGPTHGGGGDVGLPPSAPDPAAERRYYVAVSSNERLPTQLNAPFVRLSDNTSVRLEPIDSLDRVAEDRVGILDGPTDLGLAPTPFTLSDVTLFVSTATTLVTVDAMRGGIETTLPNYAAGGFSVGDLLMRSDGTMYVYRGVNGNTTTAGQLARIDTGTGAVAAVIGNDQIKDPTVASQINVPSAGGGTVATTTFNLTGKFLRQPQVTPITGTVRYQYVDTTVVPNVQRTGTWTFTANPAAVNGIATLTIGAGTFVNGPTNSAPSLTPGAATVNLETGVVSILWTASVPAAAVQLANISYASTFQDVATDLVDAVAWQRTGIGTYDQLVYSVWDPGSGTSFLYQGNGATGSAAYIDGLNWGLQGTLTAGGVRTTGLAWLGGTLYGVDDAGNLFSIAGVDDGNFTITTTPIATITVGGAPIAFEGLTAGPPNLNGGAFAGLLFAIDGGGNLYCFNTAGVLQAVFDSDPDGGGPLRPDGVPDATSIATGAAGATGLAFSPLDINLWHGTTRRGTDAGGSGTSMYFGLENVPAFQAGGSFPWQQDLLSNPVIGNNYNLPGGAYGSMTTNPFSLAGYTYTDKPTIYFDYWLQTQDAESRTNLMRDSARVLISSDGGLTWQLVATNNSTRSTINTTDAELPNFTSVSSRITTTTNQHVQELFDTSNWRQARIDLGEWAGKANLRLRFDFSTAGEFDATQRRGADGYWANDIASLVLQTPGNVTVGSTTISLLPTAANPVPTANLAVGMTVYGTGVAPSAVITAILNGTDVSVSLPSVATATPTPVSFYQPELANTTGNFNSPERGQNNAWEGFYIDDIVIGFAERGERVVSGAETQAQDPVNSTGFFDIATPAPTATVAAQVLNGPYQLEIRRGTEYAGVQTFDTNDRLIGAMSNTTNFGAKLGDANLPREQGQFVIESNIVTGASQYGIRIDAAARDGGSNVPHPGTPRNLPTLNNERLAPGVVVTNNILAGSRVAGILFSGDATAGNVPQAAVPFGRIVNNTIYGGATPVGIGVQITDNAGPTLLNNLFANLAQSVSADSSSGSRTVVGTSAYWNAPGTTGVSESNAISLSASPFVNPAAGNFYLAAGSRAIDSSLDSLQDRDAFVQVNSPIGISPSPILSPERDFYGQLRSDDPGVTNLSGLGTNVFKDRGAIDRVDFTQPYAQLANPLDGEQFVDLDAAPDAVAIRSPKGGGMSRFELQLADSGVGIDDSTVNAGGFTLRRDGTLLVEGVDYLFRYLPNTNRVVFEAVAVFRPGTYQIQVVQDVVDGRNVNRVADLAGNRLLANKPDGTTSFIIRLVGLPAAPSNLTGTAGNAQVALAWSAPTSDGGSAISNYKVQYSTNGLTWLPPTGLLVGSPTTAYTVTGLTNGTPYYFRVCAVNEAGDGPFVQTLVTITPRIPAPAPLTLAAVPGSGQVALSWIAPTVPLGETITGYHVEYKPAGAADWTTHTASTAASNATVPGLVNGISYGFRVTTLTTLGRGLAAEITSTPVGLPPAPTGLVVSRGNGALVATWDPAPFGSATGGLPLLDYQIEYLPAGATTWVVFPDGTSTVASATVTGLTNGTAYLVRVAARNTAGLGPYATANAAVAPLPLPFAPTRVTGRVVNGMVSLAWTAPRNTGGFPIVNYAIQYSTNSVNWFSLPNTDSSTARATVTVPYGLTYTFRVAAVTTAGVGAYSSPTPRLTPFLGTAVPQAPSGFGVTPAVRSATLTWTPPPTNEGGPISGYVVQYRTGSSATWRSVTVRSATATSYTFSRLRAGNYSFRVQARNLAGLGTFSEEWSGTIS